MELTVWAPHAETVEAEVDGGRHGMTRVDDGWWTTTTDPAGPGADYWFSVDGGPLRPDPRSPWQPHGVDGPSRVDHTDFPWTDDHWHGFHLPGAVLYELHIGTFSEAGTFDGAIGHLDHLVDLGVDAVEVMPVAEFSGARGWGYDGVALYAPHHAYGGPDGFRRFVDACHARGLGVLLDVVYNHLGPHGNHLATFGPYFSEHHHTNWGEGVNVDGPLSDEVRRWIIDNARHWFVDHHVDGLRLDAVHAIADDSAVHVLEQLAEETAALSPHVRRPLWLIAESDRNDPRYVRPTAAGGFGLDASWADEWHHALHTALTGETDGYYEDFADPATLVRALEQAWVYAGDYSEHRSRHHGRSPAGLAGHQFVVSVQNHDQIGNRATGDRLGHSVSAGRLKLAAALMLTGPFTPMLFQGEEWGASSPFTYFTAHEDPDLADAVRRGRRSEFSSFGWDPEEIPDPQAEETFTDARLPWDEVAAPGHDELLGWYRSLIALRREVPELTDGRWQQGRATFDRSTGVVTYERGPVLVAGNLGRQATDVILGDRTVVLTTDRASQSTCTLDPDDVVVAIG